MGALRGEIAQVGMKLRDQWSGLFWLVFSAFVCVESVRMGRGSFHSPGPGFLPFWAGVVVSGFSLLLFVKGTVKKEEGGEIQGLWIGPGWRKIILVAGSLLVYPLLLPRLGFLITTFGLLTFLFSAIERSKLWIKAFTALFTVIVMYMIFYLWLGVQLPRGILGF